MKNDEPYNPNIKSSEYPLDLTFRLVTRNDRDSIVSLTAYRNPTQELGQIQKNTDKELENGEKDPNFRLFVADLNGKVVGFCQFYNCTALPVSKRIYPAPDGWYGLGIMVAPEMRRNGIARFLSLNRLKILKQQGIKELFSIVDSKNLTSLHMHRQFGFEEIEQAEGFLHVKLDSGKGSLFKINF